MKILVINAGSSSLKYQLIDMDGEKLLAKGNCERIGDERSTLSGKTANGAKFKKEVFMKTHIDAFNEVKNILTCGEYKVINDLSEISAVGHRVVQGGALFNKSCIVNDEVVTGIESLISLAPLHNPAHIMGIKAATELFGYSVPQVVVFDNAFHSTMPEKAYMYALPYKYYEKYAVRKYGAHGTSHRYVSTECAKYFNGKKDLKIITCHLGNGSSITAVKNGKCIDTSMGLTPVDGLVMGTRTGIIDPSAVLYVMEKENLTPSEMSTLINKKSGYLGLTDGYSSDDLDLTIAASKGDEKCKLAREMQQYGIVKFIGAYTAALNGVDAIVFTGGIGENAADTRNVVCSGISDFLGVEINDEMNEKFVRGVGGEISTENSKVRVFVIPTNEELMIARDTKALVEGKVLD